jgi:hypothetical protein
MQGTSGPLSSLSYIQNGTKSRLARDVVAGTGMTGK